MTDNYEATVETDRGTFTFKGPNPRVVSAQAARMPVKLHEKQIRNGVDLATEIQRYLEKIAHEEKKERQKNRSIKQGRFKPRHKRD